MLENILTRRERPATYRNRITLNKLVQSPNKNLMLKVMLAQHYNGKTILNSKIKSS